MEWDAVTDIFKRGDTNLDNNLVYHNLNIIPTFFAKSYHKVAV
jgi:hypothetical protein